MGGLQGTLQEGRVWFYENGRYGFLNEEADVVVPPVLEEASNFYDGLCLAKRGGRYGFLDRDGHEVVPCRYRRATHFCGDRALVWEDDGQRSFINRRGERLAPCLVPFDDAWGLWHDGRMRIRRGALHGFLDLEGREAVPCRYPEAHERFASGRAGVRREGRWGFVDRDGNEVVPPQFDWVEPFYEGVGTAGVRAAGGYGRIDPDGRVCVRCAWVNPVGRFSEGRAQVDLGPIVDPGRDGEGTLVRAQIGFVDEGGALVIPCQYETATDFRDGVAWVTTPTQRARFAIDRAGRPQAT
ncbi:MAG: WG repeat-containing protein [Polyangiales bacterium]